MRSVVRECITETFYFIGNLFGDYDSNGACVRTRMTAEMGEHAGADNVFKYGAKIFTYEEVATNGVKKFSIKALF